MATQTITYTNKVDLYTDSSIADINKVKASDMNEIKSVVNNNANEIPIVQNTYGTGTNKVYSCDYINGVDLYTNLNGSKDTITLSDNPFNYTRIDIIFGPPGVLTDYAPNQMTTYPKFSNWWTMTYNWQENSWGGILGQKITYEVNGTTYQITRSRTNYLGGNYQGFSNYWSNYTDGMMIVKVIGYK